MRGGRTRNLPTGIFGFQDSCVFVTLYGGSIVESCHDSDKKGFRITRHIRNMEDYSPIVALLKTGDHSFLSVSMRRTVSAFSFSNGSFVSVCTKSSSWPYFHIAQTGLMLGNNQIFTLGSSGLSRVDTQKCKHGDWRSVPVGSQLDTHFNAAVY